MLFGLNQNPDEPGRVLQSAIAELKDTRVEKGQANVVTKKRYALALKEAVRTKKVDFIRMLCRAGAYQHDREFPDGNFATNYIYPFHHDISESALPVLKAIFEPEKDPEAKTGAMVKRVHPLVDDSLGNCKCGCKTPTLLMKAAESDDLEGVKYLLSLGANINFKDYGDGTALSEAASNNFLEVVLELLKSGAEIGLRDRFAKTPLRYAVMHGNYPMVVAFFSNNPPPTKEEINEAIYEICYYNVGYHPGKNNPLVHGDFMAIGKLLLEKGAEINLNKQHWSLEGLYSRKSIFTELIAEHAIFFQPRWHEFYACGFFDDQVLIARVENLDERIQSCKHSVLQKHLQGEKLVRDTIKAAEKARIQKEIELEVKELALGRKEIELATLPKEAKSIQFAQCHLGQYIAKKFLDYQRQTLQRRFGVKPETIIAQLIICRRELMKFCLSKDDGKRGPKSLHKIGIVYIVKLLIEIVDDQGCKELLKALIKDLPANTTLDQQRLAIIAKINKEAQAYQNALVQCSSSQNDITLLSSTTDNYGTILVAPAVLRMQ